MAKRLFLLHIGPAPVDVAAMTAALAVGGVAVPDVAADVLDARRHRDPALPQGRRPQAQAGRGLVGDGLPRARKTEADCFVSVPGFFDATPEQAALALDELAGLPGGPRGDQRLRRRAAGRLDAAGEGATRTHVLPSHLTDEQLAAQVARIALMEEEARLDKRLAKVSRRRRLVDRRLAA